MRALDRKLLRDLSGMKGQMTAIALVMACGLSMMIMARGLVVSLEETERRYYGTSRLDRKSVV
jgi:putative ABC transport system permease protein